MKSDSIRKTSIIRAWLGAHLQEDCPIANRQNEATENGLHAHFYFQSFLRDMFLSLSFFMTLATAISKSS